MLLRPVLRAGEGASRVVDATVGGGGHAAAFLAGGARVLGIDRDPDAIAAARVRLGEAGITYLEASFGAPVALAAVASFRPEFILLDLGVSSRQLDDPSRGFTFRPGAPLDMRMGEEGDSAAELLNGLDQASLTKIFTDYADERKSGRLAREIVRRRERVPFAISDDLVNAIRAVLGPRSGPGDFARLFQAIRIAVNDELEVLEHALVRFRDALAPGGRLAVISYHSGEDRVVKHLFRDWARACICPSRSPVCTCRGHPLGRMEPTKPIVADAAEVAANPRARSARLRVFRVGHGA
ncbi:MAG: 16S rRNA (cytosine(1402)-N(4))-methyltransferase RsmH [Gemmatimonadales bacterium]